ncbi:lytic transglycosylase domain-containing protein [Vibrio hepatarius]|uniref:lytic transglycosylase domain-containing protein n=1 Tax=Vibrio hepatarius TaxID=171383 RepID=UPI001C08D43C|nr:lytic transglycosylase domain-containing protein [Vibrio hepatarius]MBU2898662.1 lytic transglycosylase domain-containing protein [Vibrio hepatarius]
MVVYCFSLSYINASPMASDIETQWQVLSPYKAQIEVHLKNNQSLIDKIADKLKVHSLPIDFILIPMLESSYDPSAISHADAAGLWQLMPATAKRFGLQVSADKDQRFNVQASTKAAVLYLQFLYTKFGDIALTLAAYNAGEGRVARAITQAESRHFSELQLPKETRRYVHRFYALRKLIQIKDILQGKKSRLYLFDHQNTLPLINLSPLPPLVTL